MIISKNISTACSRSLVGIMLRHWPKNGLAVLPEFPCNFAHRQTNSQSCLHNNITSLADIKTTNAGRQFRIQLIFWVCHSFKIRIVAGRPSSVNPLCLYMRTRPHTQRTQFMQQKVGLNCQLKSRSPLTRVESSRERGQKSSRSAIIVLDRSCSSSRLDRFRGLPWVTLMLSSVFLNLQHVFMYSKANR